MLQMQNLQDFSPLYVHPGIMKFLIYFDRLINPLNTELNPICQ